jgi:probable addiction module antidote protein
LIKRIQSNTVRRSAIFDDWLTRLAIRRGGAMKTEYAPLDVSSYLTDEETIAEFLTAAAEDENPDVLLRALAEVAKARGMARVARDAGLGRESLYKALAPGSHPRFETITAVLRAVGVRIVAQAPKKPARVKAMDPNIGVAVAGLRASKRKSRAHA